jgi:hypothetical protein
MNYEIVEEQSHVLQYVVEADSEEEAITKWLVTNGEGFDFKDLDDYFFYYEVKGV